MPNYTFDPARGGYVDLEGLEVALTTVADALDLDIGASMDEMERISRAFMDGEITLSEWRKQMRDEIEGIFTRSFVLGVGGEGAAQDLTTAQWQVLAELIAIQFDYLDRFYLEIQDKMQSAEAGEVPAIAGRARMYGGAAQQAFWGELGKVLKQAGFTQERWLLGPVTTEHCDDCPRLEKMGWVKIGTHPEPGDGNTRCLSNCRCRKEYKHKDGRIY